ncbi:hypothetical protein [Actinophytocola oryzae]|uniref:Uncharacterized protein n=1 Tax=Actinophytocola oryzae TaxID=502181 RepID=A0A4R7VJR9_9PSEU|nr:hypothetical protein [Actinophytocola oryzae]TDV49694.1 hypothetical protein CLV71_10733 [Actinophytocola oryzae]
MVSVMVAVKNTAGTRVAPIMIVLVGGRAGRAPVHEALRRGLGDGSGPRPAAPMTTSLPESCTWSGR